MAGKITIECPACFAKLNISDPSKLGKKIKCPKCQEIFAPAPIEDDDAFEDEEDEPKSPSSRKRAAGGSKKSSKKAGKGKSSEGGSNAPLIIGSIAALLVVVGVGLYFSGVFGGSKTAPVAASPTQPPMSAPANMAGAHSGPPNMGMPNMGMPNPAAGHSAPPNMPMPNSAAGPSAGHSPGARSAAAPQVAKTGEMTPAEKALGLKWLPADTDFIIHIKPAELCDAPLLKKQLSDPMVAQSIQQLQAASDLAPADVESVTIGIRGIVDAVSMGFAAGAMGQAPPTMNPANQTFVVVLKSKKPIELKQFLKNVPAVMKEKNGKTYAEAPPAPMSPPSGAWCPDSKTIIFATTKELLATIDNGETETTRKEFASLDYLPHLIVATFIPDMGSDSKSSAAAKNPGVGMAMAMLQPYNLKMANIALTIKGGFELQVSALSGTEDGRKQLKSAADLGLTLARAQFANYKKTGIPLVAELGETLLTNLKIDEQNQTVKLSTSIPDSDQAKIEQLGPILMMTAMTGGFNNLGGPGLGGPSGGGFPGGPVKQPGETESVDAIKSDGLPDGTKLSAKTAWGLPAAGPADGKSTIALDIMVEVTGDGLESICGASAISTKTMSLDGGGSLKKVKRTGGGDASKGFTPFDAKDDTSFDHPPQTLRVKIEVEPPASGATKIDVLEGSFKFLTSADAKEFSIDEVPKKNKRPINDPEMKPFDVKWRRGTSGVTPESFSLWCGKDHFLGKVVGNPGNVVSMTESENNQTVQRLHSNHEGGKFPDDFQIKFTVHPQVKEHTATFRFENVPLPAPESKPQ